MKTTAITDWRRLAAEPGALVELVVAAGDARDWLDTAHGFAGNLAVAFELAHKTGIGSLRLVRLALLAAEQCAAALASTIEAAEHYERMAGTAPECACGESLQGAGPRPDLAELESLLEHADDPIFGVAELEELIPEMCAECATDAAVGA